MGNAKATLETRILLLSAVQKHNLVYNQRRVSKGCQYTIEGISVGNTQEVRVDAAWLLGISLVNIWENETNMFKYFIHIN